MATNYPVPHVWVAISFPGGDDFYQCSQCQEKAYDHGTWDNLITQGCPNPVKGTGSTNSTGITATAPAVTNGQTGA